MEILSNINSYLSGAWERTKDIVPAFSQAFEKYKEAKEGGHGFLARLGILASAFNKEWMALKTEREAVTEETEEEIDEAITPTSTEDKSPALAFAEQTSSDPVIGKTQSIMAAADKKLPGKKKRKAALAALAKGKTPSVEEVASLGGVAAESTLALKKEAGSSSKLAKIIDKIKNTASQKKSPFSSFSALANLANASKLEILSFVKKHFNMGLLDARKLSELQKPSPNYAKLVPVMKKFFFPHTSDSNVKDVCILLKKASQSKNPDSELIADIVFKIDNRDVSGVAEKLVAA